MIGHTSHSVENGENYAGKKNDGCTLSLYFVSMSIKCKIYELMSLLNRVDEFTHA